MDCGNWILRSTAALERGRQALAIGDSSPGSLTWTLNKRTVSSNITVSPPFHTPASPAQTNTEKPVGFEQFQNYSVTTRTATDSWTHAHNLPGWQHVYEQIKRGPYEGLFTVAWLGPIQLIHERVSGPGVYRGRAWEGARVFSYFHQGNGCLNNQAVPEHSLIDWRWDGIDHVIMRDTAEGFLMAVDERWLVNQLSSCTVTPFHFDNVRPKFRCPDSRIAQAFVSESTELLRQLAADPTLLDSPRCRTAAQKSAEDLLLRTFQDEMAVKQSLPRPSTRAYIVDRAMQYIEAAMHDSVSILDLCGAMRICPRTLVYSFKSQLGVSPNRYLLATRLNRVYRDLRNSSSEIPIRQIAARWGFWHMGRFASYYRETFGERPSDTVRTAKRTRKQAIPEERISWRAGPAARLSVVNG